MQLMKGIDCRLGLRPNGQILDPMVGLKTRWLGFRPDGRILRPNGWILDPLVGI
jgi:hypothetical protein